MLCSVPVSFRFVLFFCSVLFVCLFVCLLACLLACLFTGVLCDLKLKLFFCRCFYLFAFFGVYWPPRVPTLRVVASYSLRLSPLFYKIADFCRCDPGVQKKIDCILQIEKITAYPRVSCMTVCYVSTCFQQLICYESRSFDLWSCKLEISQQF